MRDAPADDLRNRPFVCAALAGTKGVALRILFVSALFVLIAAPAGARAATVVADDISADTVWTAAQSPYIIQFSDFRQLKVNTGATLTIEPGVVVKFAGYNGMEIYGTLRATGTADQPIYFTSLADDVAGGDTDGVVAEPGDEQWMHLEFETGSTGNLDYIVVRYGGATIIFSMTGIANNGGTVTLDHSRLSRNGYDGFGHYSGTTRISNSEFDNHKVGIMHGYPGGELYVDASDIHDNSYDGLLLSYGTTTITGSNIHDNDIGIYAERGAIMSVRDSLIHGNNAGVENGLYDEAVIDAVSNWWGAATGPKHATNSEGTGDSVTDLVTFSPFLTADPSAPVVPACTADCFSNVLFLPGIESSRLYRAQVVGSEEKKLWEPGVNDDLSDLWLMTDGKSTLDVYTKENDVVDELPAVGKNIYKSFISKMDELKTQEKIKDWKAAPYDWRLSLDDILNYGNNIGGKIYYSGNNRATTTPYIIQELRRLAKTSKSKKVTVIAHSNGGLVAKRLIEILGEEAPTLIDKMIFVAVPQVGTPMAVAAGLHGYDQAHLGGLITDEDDARTFSSTTPMIYNLMPSAGYFAQVKDAVVKFEVSLALSDWIDHYGNLIRSENKLQDYLTGFWGKVDAKTGDIDQPITMNYSMLADAKELHAMLDAWTPPAGIELIQIAGWGVPKTVSGITYKAKKEGGVKPEPDFTIDGDGTVVVPSALWTSTSTGAVNYWVDIATYNKIGKKITHHSLLDVDHGSILEVEGLRKFISDVITNSTKPMIDYTNLSVTSPYSVEKRLRYALHSPLTLDLYDDLGNHTGIATSTGEVEENIPGTYYVQFGDTKYIFADMGTLQHVVMSGYDTGTFTFEIGELEGDTVMASTTFRDVPVTPQTQVRFSVSSGIGTASDLSVDENGDGIIDSSYASSTGQLIVPPAPPVENTPAPSPSGGGGGIPSLLPQGMSSVATIATSSVIVASTTSETRGDSSPNGGGVSSGSVFVTIASTSTAPIIAQNPAKKIAQVKFNVAKKKVGVATSTTKDSKPNSQIASVAQATGDGLLLRVRRWIMNTIHSLLKL